MELPKLFPWAMTSPTQHARGSHGHPPFDEEIHEKCKPQVKTPKLSFHDRIGKTKEKRGETPLCQKGHLGVPAVELAVGRVAKAVANGDWPSSAANGWPSRAETTAAPMAFKTPALTAL